MQFYCSDTDYFALNVSATAIIYNSAPSDDCWKTKSRFIYISSVMMGKFDLPQTETNFGCIWLCFPPTAQTEQFRAYAEQLNADACQSSPDQDLKSSQQLQFFEICETSLRNMALK